MKLLLNFQFHGKLQMQFRLQYKIAVYCHFEGWVVRAYEQFGSSSLTLDEVTQDSSWVQVKDVYTFSWELKRLSFDNDLSGNWRRMTALF